MKRWLVACVLGLAFAARAATFTGTVTYVTDGDTLWVRPAGGGGRVEIRLLDIDAPEGCQAHGAQARDALRARVLHQAVRVQTQGRDDYGRQLARVAHRGEDVGAWLVREGHAWAMRFHGKPGVHGALEAKARLAHKGLWAAPGPVEPRSFRRRFGRCH